MVVGAGVGRAGVVVGVGVGRAGVVVGAGVGRAGVVVRGEGWEGRCGCEGWGLGGQVWL